MQFEISAKKREAQGSGASRRLRRAGKVPGILYGGGEDALPLELDHQELILSLRHEAFHASVLNLNVDGKKQHALLRDVQMHAYKNLITHVDFQRVDAKTKIHMKVPFHFTNQENAPGVKLAHGIVSHVMTEADVSCLPKDLPEFIEIDLGAVEAGQSVHLSQVKLPKGVEFVQLAHGDDAVVVTCAKPRGASSSEGEGEAAA